MTKPPRKDDSYPSEATSDDPDRAAILARRQRFIALALTGLAAACDKPNDEPATPRDTKAVQDGKGDDGGSPQPCLNVERTPDPVEASTGKPVPCLEVAAPPDDDPFASPNACLKIAVPEEDEPETPPRPHACLKVKRPEPEPGKPRPQPCLKVARPDPEPAPEKPKPKPQPCLKVAKPK